MDLRTIINADASASRQSRQQPSPSPQRESAPVHDYSSKIRGNGGSPLLHRDATRPPQPTPYPTPLPHPSPARSMSFGSAPSPYQHPSSLHPAPRLQTGPPHPLQTTMTSSNHGAAGAAYPQSAGASSSPFTPHPGSAGTPQSYISQTRSHSSIHSASTPTSSRSFSYPAPLQPPPPPPPAPLRRDSSSSASHHGIAPPHPQPYSPTQQRSQPGTPLARPAPSYPLHQSPHAVRPLSSGGDANPSSLGSPWTRQDAQRRDYETTMSPVVRSSPSRQNSNQHYFHQPPHPEQNRDTTLSVSPKSVTTSLGNNSHHDMSRASLHSADLPGHFGRIDASDPKWHAPQNSNTVQSLAPRSILHDSSLLTQPARPPTTPRLASYPSAISPSNSTVSPHSKQPSIKDMSPAPVSRRPTTEPMASDPPSAPSESTSVRPKKRRKRYDEPPIFARQAPRKSGAPPAIPGRQNVPSAPPAFLPPKPPPRKPDNFEAAAARSTTPRQTQPFKDGGTNGHPMNGMITAPPPQERKDSILGSWEPSITGLIPHEELTKLICDFLFEQVVMRKDIGAAAAGAAAAAAGAGAILEVEAKLGQLVDKNRGGRLRLPVLTECVLSRDDPSIRIGFESSMSLAQHRALNNFLNDSVKASLTPGASRIPLAYAHKKERDSFYEIAAGDLPPIVQHHLNPRHKPKVRVTTDQKTGAVLARIIKCRIADLDVYSPKTCLDWRISVNLEMNYQGNVGDLVLANEPPSITGTRRGGDRNKDRMSYRHLAYQIDLTQVANSETQQAPPDFEHELEVEISSAEVRRQGDLALAGDPSNRYEELVKGFVDNIRVLARAVPPY